MVAKEFDGYIEAMDQPCIDGLNVYMVSKFTRQNVTVALSGLGPDELFLGYKWQRTAMPPAWFNKPAQQLFGRAFPLLKVIWPKRYIGILDYLKEVKNPLEFYTQINRVLSDREIETLLGHSFDPDLNTKWISDYDSPDEKEIYSRISRLDIKLFMGARVLGISDTTSMYNSLEVRFPLIDKRIVEFSRTIPPHYKMDIAKAARIKPWSNYEGNKSYEGSGVKKILYEAFKNELPSRLGPEPKRGLNSLTKHG